MALAGAAQGWLLRPASLFQRGLLLIAALALIKPGLITDIVGFGLLVLVMGFNIVMLRRARAAA
jgi:UPF0716 family protein affecting phage T7 exclusion